MTAEETETTAWVRGWTRGGQYGISFIRTVPRAEGIADRVANGGYVTADVDWDAEGNIMGVTLLWGMDEPDENGPKDERSQLCPHGLHFNGYYCDDCSASAAPQETQSEVEFDPVGIDSLTGGTGPRLGGKKRPRPRLGGR